MQKYYAGAGISGSVLRVLLLFCVLLLAAVSVSPALAQANDEGPIVFAVLFYSPSCPHCHKVIVEDYPKFQQEFGNQFRLLFIDVSTLEGQWLYMAACDTYNIPGEQRGVPMMILDDQVMVGSVDIPAQAPGLIRAGLEAGGIGLPAIPGLQELYEAALAKQEQETPTEEPALEEESTPEADAETEPAPEAQPGSTAESTPQAVAEAESGPQSTGENPQEAPADVLVAPDESAFDSRSATLSERLAHDPLGNSLAVGVLLGLTASLVGVVLGGLESLNAGVPAWLAGRPARLVALLFALVGLALSITLVFQESIGPLAVPMATGLLLIMLVVVFVLLNADRRRRRSARSRPRIPAWLLPLVSLAGLLVAVYLSYVEVGQVETLCGMIGDCNTVQQSAYARLFGVLPVGVLGVIGCVAIMLAWAVGQLDGERTDNLSHAALLVMILFGVAFSIYLTFLEPFVIGATCAWCLTSAVLMVLMLWLEAPKAWAALRELRGN